MTDDSQSLYDGALERTADGGVIRFVRHLPFPVEEVWAAVTDPARLADWWLPFDADITVDLREGGQMVFAARDADGPTLTCTILRVEAPLLLEHTHGDGVSNLRWELERTGSGCTLRLSHFVRDPQQAIDDCYVVGLFTSLARLEPCLAGHPEPWDWDGFARAQQHYATVGLAPPVDPS